MERSEWALIGFLLFYFYYFIFLVLLWYRDEGMRESDLRTVFWVRE